MGHINLASKELTGTISEAAGFKTGITLSKEEIFELLPEESRYKELFSVDDEVFVRLHSYDLDELFTNVLYYLGNIESPTPMSHTAKLFHKYKDDEKLSKVYQEVQKIYILYLKKVLKDASSGASKTIDPTDFMTEAVNKYGKDGLNMSYELVMGNSEELHSRLSSYRRFEWEDTIELEGLFKSESIEAKYGRFIDQRYIDYLDRNGYYIKKMNWRKFEALTAEYFDREGFKVELGPGRNDGGIDVRVWKDDSSNDDPPLILIQCKRHKEKIDRTVVKALWADMEWEKSESGMIVTTSSIAHGAKKDCVARGYNIKQADSETIQVWLEKMRTPGSGVFMGT